ncbi:adenylosuccinate lyase [Candidatus Micrarchaeota archaeon]|nr:adenylosuccinate lyase [Candidatus Micrarchaeota archaeon]
MAVSPLDSRYKTEMTPVFDEENKLRKWMEVEVALAKAHALLGHIPEEAPGAIEAGMEKVKVERAQEIEAEIHHDLMAMVRALSEQSGEYGGYIHIGATSYDIEDTATALIFREAIEVLENRLKTLNSKLKTLAKAHKKTVCIGRTHGQHANPTTYGMKFAVYYQEIKRNLKRLEEAKETISVGKMSGATGTMAAFGREGIQMQELVMEELDLKPAKISTQVIQRDRHAQVLCTLGIIAGTLEKMAKEIRNLSRPEMGELSEPFGKKQVGSSTMPHKRNPHKSERICSLARVVRANVQTALENIPLEHERDLTNSANERFIFPESFIVTDYMAKQMAAILEGLEFYSENIQRNLELTKGLVMAERVMMALVEKGMSRQEAHEAVREVAQKAFREKKSLREALSESEAGKQFSEKELDGLMDPSTYLGKAEEIVDSALD